MILVADESIDFGIIRILQENNVSVEQIKNWNNLEGGKIIPGQKIKILITG